jgi:hypothetical protein
MQKRQPQWLPLFLPSLRNPGKKGACTNDLLPENVILTDEGGKDLDSG